MTQLREVTGEDASQETHPSPRILSEQIITRGQIEKRMQDLIRGTSVFPEIVIVREEETQTGKPIDGTPETLSNDEDPLPVESAMTAWGRMEVTEEIPGINDHFNGTMRGADQIEFAQQVAGTLLGWMYPEGMAMAQHVHDAEFVHARIGDTLEITVRLVQEAIRGPEGQKRGEATFTATLHNASRPKNPPASLQFTLKAMTRRFVDKMLQASAAATKPARQSSPLSAE